MKYSPAESQVTPSMFMKWHTFFQDQDILDEIEKDVKRTRTELKFFSRPLDSKQNTPENQDRLKRQDNLKKSEMNQDDLDGYIETHADNLTRILFIYAKLNPGIKYTQGMNEILGVLYYCFQGLEESSYIPQKYIESDLFCAFCNIMTDIRDCFLRELDQEPTGVSGHISNYTEVMSIVSPEVLQTIEGNQVIHSYYSLRWFMLLMCQEFSI